MAEILSLKNGAKECIVQISARALHDIEEEFSEHVRYMMLYATFTCLDLLFSIFFHVPFSQSSFQIDPISNEYLLAKIGVDTAENELI